MSEYQVGRSFIKKSRQVLYFVGAQTESPPRLPEDHETVWPRPYYPNSGVRNAIAYRGAPVGIRIQRQARTPIIAEGGDEHRRIGMMV